MGRAIVFSSVALDRWSEEEEGNDIVSKFVEIFQFSKACRWNWNWFDILEGGEENA